MKRKAPCLGSGAPSSLALVALHTVRVGPPPRKRSEEEVAKFIEQTLCVDAVLDPEKGMVTYLPAGNPTFRLLSKDIKQAISTVNKKSHLALVEKGVQTETGFLDLLEMADSLGLKLRNEVVNEDDFSLLNLTNVPSFADVLLSTASTSSSSKGTARSEASKVLTIILREDVGIPLSLKKALQTCTKRGLVDCLTVLAEEFGSLGRFERIIYEEDLCALAARYNQLAVIKWFGGKRPRCGAPRKHLTVLTLKNAIAYRHLSLAKWLRAHKCPLNLSIWEGLVWTGNDALFMKFVDLLKDLPFSDDYLTFLAEENHPRTMYFLMEKQVPFNHHTFAAAAGSENLELMKALHAKGCNVTKFAGFSACDHENLEIFEYLKKVGCPLTSATMEFAAQEGQLNVLKWLKEESVELTRNCFLLVAYHGHLNCLQWMEKVYEEPIDWFRVAELAVFGTQMDIIQDIIQKKRNYETMLIYQALASKMLEIVEKDRQTFVEKWSFLTQERYPLSLETWEKFIVFWKGRRYRVPFNFIHKPN